MTITEEIKTLTAREFEIFKLLILTNSPRIVIANQLNISSPTIDIHIDSIYRKLHKHSRVGLILWVIKERIIKIEEIRI